MTPTSYQAPTRNDVAPKTVSQSTQSNLETASTTVAQLIANKGNVIFSVKAENTIKEAVILLREHRIGALVVLNDAGQLEGILSERDIVRKLADTPGQTLPQLVGDLMTKEVVTCSPSELVVTVLRNMTHGKFRHMPVIDQGKLCGIITIGDVVNYRLNELEYETLQMKQLIVG